jgi:2-polyprenyl-3-methyl-5-hydroxy-6-metoxy-1,4-benzoquinol methylase
MDRPTLDAYDHSARAYADDWHEQPPPTDLHDIVRRYFRHGATADIGCGSGREVSWLAANGYPATGYDASDGLLAEARRRYPDLKFESAALPQLEGVARAAFDNVLCETVIMHLPPVDIAGAARSLVSLLKPNGVLYLSWRVTPDGDQRDKSGRLYAAFDAALVRNELKGMTLLLDEEVVSASSGKTIHRLVAQR